MGMLGMQSFSVLRLNSPLSTIQVPERRVLTSWKEIATHMNAGVRTVQRYEREFGLPVRRLLGKRKAAVRAYTHELDAWMRERAAMEWPLLEEDHTRERCYAAFSEFKVTMSATLQSLEEYRRLRNEGRSLREGFGQSANTLRGSILRIGVQSGPRAGRC